MKIKKKIFSSGSELFCYPDTLLNKFIPQAWQIFIMKSFISEYNKKISFYTGESHKTYKKTKLLKKKLMKILDYMDLFFFHFYNFVMIKKIT